MYRRIQKALIYWFGLNEHNAALWVGTYWDQNGRPEELDLLGIEIGKAVAGYRGSLSPQMRRLVSGGTHHV